MPVKLINTQTEVELAAGKTGHYWWNNASPAKGVWSANAVASITGSSSAGFNQDTQLEVTRLWRRFKVVETSSSSFSDTDIETEVHYTVKNLGSKKARFVVFLSVTY